jgi:hypothetical protein
LLEARVEKKLKTNRITGTLNRLHVAMPTPRDDKERCEKGETGGERDWERETGRETWREKGDREREGRQGEDREREGRRDREEGGEGGRERERVQILFIFCF